MNFSNVPDNVWMDILQRLPLKQRVRIGGVNRLFKNLSDKVISRTTKLSFSKELDGIPMASLTKLLQLCADHLQEAEFKSKSYAIVKEWIKEFSKYEFPRLAVLDVNITHMEARVLCQLLIDCPKMRRLQLRCSNIRGELPIVVCNSLESVALKWGCTVQAFETIVECCPNLKKLDVVVTIDGNANDANRWRQALNQAFSKRRGLEALDIEVWYMLGDGDTGLLGVPENLLLLHSLRSMKLGMNDTFTDQILTAMSTSLSQLEHLELRGEFESWHGIAALRLFKKLRRFDLDPQGGPIDQPSPLDPGLRQLASSQSLEEVKTSSAMLTQETVYTFARECPRLKRLTIDGIHGITSLAQIKSFVNGLGCFVQDNLTIHLEKVPDRNLLLSETVQETLAKVNEAAGGRQISIVVPAVAVGGAAIVIDIEEQGYIGWLMGKVINFFRSLYQMIFG